jgi:hypothetical protein
MNNEDLRDVMAFGALIGLVMRGEATIDAGYLAYRYADATLDAREEGDEGIASVKIKRRKKSVPE